MKYIGLITIIFILFFVSLFPSRQTLAAGSNPYCLGVSGTFSASNWPGGTIDVACAGDTGTAGCSGHVTTLSPGQSFDFNNCTCAPYGTEGDGGTTGLKGGCVWVGKDLTLAKQANGNILVKGDTSMPAGCTLNNPQPIACGANGQVISSPFSITCQAPPTPTPTKVPTPTPTKIPTPTPTKVPTPTSVPTPTACPAPSQVLNVKVTCPNCPPVIAEEEK